ncbi:SOS response-associated peptidase [Rhizobiales bacterium]|uniref:SOS response-associated peptidase n=1 Tax=Hongsoonwoonella zoysiae TaxID=2821844 RepID=UPI00155FBEAD|nr:SOS response-associated peptidase [Hongsoonwoonella zoysiae]NRG19720.1 SOS response-associated peptidase [Hongsoonwoonella zoysiae]
MCGRFALTASPEEVRALLQYLDQPNFPPRFNIAPTQPIAIVRQDHGKRRFALVRWGLVPGWVKDPASFTLLINARSETAAEKPSFRTAMRHRRCLIPASGFYEWKRPDGGPKQPYWIRPKDGGLVAFAGLWEEWADPDGGEIETGAILTIEANRTVGEIHNRMPVVIAPENFDDWLDVTNVTAKEAAKILKPAPEDLFEAIPVSTRVNSARDDDPGLQEPVDVAVVETEMPKLAPKKEKKPARKGGGQLDLF